ACIMGYGNGVAAGIFAGSQTVSASLGLLADTVREMPLDEDARSHLLLIIPACYAVTYVFGTIGTTWFLSGVAPAMMGGMKKVKEEVARIEQDMDAADATLAPGIIPARRNVLFRAYEVQTEFFDTPRTPDEICRYYNAAGSRVVGERARIGGAVLDPSRSMTIAKGDRIVLGGRADDIISLANPPGPEIADSELLNFGAERTPVTVASGKIDGMSLDMLRSQPYMQRVMVASVKRNGMGITAKSLTEIHGGDVLTLVGVAV
ncbi:MAG: aspartate-alanine antiporter, partial [Muribaculaceae bacterium]|nr:aspartate-alanine antiporter [Muribaculaceae bacterium]